MSHFYDATCLGLSEQPDVSIESEPAVEERKLALTGQVPFVLVRSYYLAPSFLLSRKTSFPLFLFSFLSAPFPLERFAASPISLFHLFVLPGRSLLSYRNLSCASSIFPKTISLPLGRGNRPNADAAGAQPVEIAVDYRARRPGTYVRTYVRTSATFAIGNFSPPTKLIVHDGSFGTSRV